jgi:hypothetical protein
MVLASGDTDMSIPRPERAKRALPDSLRGRSGSSGSGSDHFYRPGAGTLRPTGLDDGVYRAGSQRNFLKASGGKAIVAAASGGRGLPGKKSAAAGRRAPRVGERGYRGPGATYEPFFMRSTAATRSWKSSTEAVKAQPKGPRMTAAEKGIEIV